MTEWDSDFYEKSLKVLKRWVIVNLAATAAVPALYAISKSCGLEALRIWSGIMMGCGFCSWFAFAGFGSHILNNIHEEDK